MPNFTLIRGSVDTLLSTELNSLANNSQALGSILSPASSNFLYADLELVVSFGTAPTSGTSILVWLLREIDGTNYEDGGASVQPLRLFDASFPLRAVTGVQRILRRIALPPGPMRALLRNDGTGQAFASTGNALRLRPFTDQY